jgi:uncharacterized protein YecE (DUF72 family)
MTAELFMGTQGWDYGAWVGPFYPHGTKTADMLGVYSRAFPSVEVVSSAYGLPSDPSVQAWRDGVPKGFRFALKLPQEVTHERRLVDTGRIVRRFLDRVKPLGSRLGPILIQLSPAFRPTGGNEAVLAKFLDDLPPRFRWAVEFRQAGWLTPAVGEMLKQRNVATVLVDGPRLPREMMAELAIEPTADFGYVRWLGAGRRLSDFSFPQLDRDRDIEAWVEILEKLRSRVDSLYCYFSNQFQGHAPHSARKLQELLGLAPVVPEALREQAELF